MFPSQPALHPSADVVSGVTNTWKPDRVACPPGYTPLEGGGQVGSGEGSRGAQRATSFGPFVSIPSPSLPRVQGNGVSWGGEAYGRPESHLCLCRAEEIILGAKTGSVCRILLQGFWAPSLPHVECKQIKPPVCPTMLLGLCFTNTSPLRGEEVGRPENRFTSWIKEKRLKMVNKEILP